MTACPRAIPLLPWSDLDLWLALAVLLLGCPGLNANTNAAPSENPQVLRLALSSGILGEVNRNDALAAILVWEQAIMGRAAGIEYAKPRAFDSPDELFLAMREGTLDAVAVLSDEYFARLPLVTAPENIYVAVKGGKTTEQYVLLVGAASGIKDVTGLKGHSLEWHQSSRTSLAPAWIDTLLAAHQLGLPENVFAKSTRHDKVSRVINRVFFRQVDACVVALAAYEIAAELNPQLRKELRVMATSPEVVPTLFYLRPGVSAALRQTVEDAVESVHDTTGGRQAMTVFQCDRMVKQPFSCLDSARALVTAQASLRGKSTNAIAHSSLLGKSR